MAKALGLPTEAVEKCYTIYVFKAKGAQVTVLPMEQNSLKKKRSVPEWVPEAGLNPMSIT